MFQIFEQERKSDLNMINHSSSMHERTCSTTCQITLFIFKMFQIFEQEPQASSLKFSYYVTKKKGTVKKLGALQKRKISTSFWIFNPPSPWLATLSRTYAIGRDTFTLLTSNNYPPTRDNNFTAVWESSLALSNGEIRNAGAKSDTVLP